jgi:hypothetical protein
MKNRGDEPMQVIIHTYIEISQRNSLCRFLKQTKISFFSFTKSEKRRVEQILPGGRDLYHWKRGGGRERIWEGEYSVNTVYTCM